MAVVLFWLLLLVFGLFYYSRWDTRDRQMMLYRPKVKRRDVSSLSFSELLTFRQRLDNAFLSKSLISEDQMNSEEHLEYNWRNEWVKRINFLTCLWIRDKRRRRRFSVAVGGQLIPRLFRALAHFHPYVWMFTNRSMQKTRVIRFMTTLKSILLSIFISTLFFNVFYPADSICSSHRSSLESCLSVPSRILQGQSECEWNSASSECYAKAPPSSASFTITISIITTLIAIPFDLLFYFLLNVICCCRPDLEQIGLSSYEILGSELPQDKSGLLSSARQEDAILTVIQGLRIFEQRMAKGIDELEMARITAIVRAFGLRLEEGTIKLTRLSSWLYNGSLRKCIGDQISKSYSKAHAMIINLGTIEDFEGSSKSNESQRENYLLQCFVLEHFEPLSRSSLRRHFLHFTLEQTSTIHPVVWMLAWSFEITSILFFIIWILFWGASTPAQNIAFWSTNFSLNLLHEVCIVSVIRIFIINVLAVELIAPKLRELQTHLVALGHKQSQKVSAVGGMTSLIQHLSPAIVASYHSELRSLPGAELLRTINDEEPFQFRSITVVQRLDPPDVEKDDKLEYHSDEEYDNDFVNILRIDEESSL
jgi:hypothetical protein